MTAKMIEPAETESNYASQIKCNFKRMERIRNLLGYAEPKKIEVDPELLKSVREVLEKNKHFSRTFVECIKKTSKGQSEGKPIW